MYQYLPIRDVYAREILDSRGNPTLEAEVLAGDQVTGRAAVPSGASVGRYEAVELRDYEKRYEGRGVQRAIENVRDTIANSLIGVNIFSQTEIDRILCKLDGTDNKSRLGANALLGVSLACARAAAKALKIPLYQYLGGVRQRSMPTPMFAVLSGGAHGDNMLDIQEFLLVPAKDRKFSEALQMCTEIYHALKMLLKKRGLRTGVGDEGGFAPDFPDTEKALEFLRDTVEAAGYRPGEDVWFALDVAASELYHLDFGKYEFPGESKMQGKTVIRSGEELIGYYGELTERFPICAMEDPLDQEDWAGWGKLTRELGDRLTLVGDDLFATHAKRLQKGVTEKAANAILVKANQVGTLTETIETILQAQSEGYQVIVSHRSGETEDPFIVDLALAFQAAYIKAGAPCRGERTAKYNRMLRLEERM